MSNPMTAPNGIPSYITIPSSAIPITSGDLTTPSGSSGSGSTSNKRFSTASTISTSSVQRSTTPSVGGKSSFPPTASSSTGPKKSIGTSSSTAASIGSNVSDLLLSSLLPPNLPKLPPSATTSGPGKPRPLSTQRDALSLPVMSNNFRRFVTKVGPVFWMQDRIEEVLFWRKPTWTWAWMMAWVFVSFQPRLLLLAPFFTLSLILLNIHEKQFPSIPSLLGVVFPRTSSTTLGVPTTRLTSPKSPEVGYTTTTSLESDGSTTVIPAVPPKEAESGVDYYMNLQAIQNTMGWISDAHEQIVPILLQLTTPTPSPSTFPLSPTHLLIVLLIPSIFLPLTPPYLMPYLLLPLGLFPPLYFHPNLSPILHNLPRNRTLRTWRSKIERILMSDTLPDNIRDNRIGIVEVWENERLDPVVANKPLVPGLANVGYAAKSLRAGERAPWVKVGLRGPIPSQGGITGNGVSGGLDKLKVGGNTGAEESLWKSAGEAVPNDVNNNSSGEKEGVLALKEGWDWVPGEDWRVDVCGLWSDVGTDQDGWVYSDDSWQNPSASPVPDVDTTTSTSVNLPAILLRRVTRRRKWWRRVYHSDKPESEIR